VNNAASTSGDELDFAIVGGGLVGLATAMSLLDQRPDARVAVLDKEADVAAHQSGHNSGVLHAGLYYVPGSLKARFCREGRAALIDFADEHSIPYKLCGKLVVAARNDELGRYQGLLERARANGLALRELDADELAEIEPNVRGIRALHVPESGVIDFRRVAEAYVSVIERGGGSILLGHGVRNITREARGHRIETTAGTLRAAMTVTCAGLHADRLAALTGDDDGEYSIVPFRGDYYTFRPHARELVRGLVYPVPDPAFPFLGVHFTRGVYGGLTAGPNAVPAFAREGYKRFSANPRDLVELFRSAGFRRLARTYARTGAVEIWRDLVKPAFVAQLRRYVPAVESRDVVFGPSGVRAQCLGRDGSLVDDFLVRESPRLLHVLNAPSPAATASIVIGRHLAQRALAQLDL
jgi:L-2-hydroxyglutarate oxidase LhgO